MVSFCLDLAFGYFSFDKKHVFLTVNATIFRIFLLRRVRRDLLQRHGSCGRSRPHKLVGPPFQRALRWTEDATDRGGMGRQLHEPMGRGCFHHEEWLLYVGSATDR